MVHVEELRPEICSLDCGSLNFGEGNFVVINTSAAPARGAWRSRSSASSPSAEIFDTGNLWFTKQMLAEGLIDEPPLFQLCMGILGRAGGALADEGDGRPPATGANWTGFRHRSHADADGGAGRAARRPRAVGLEDNLYLERGRAREQRPAGRESGADRRGAGRARAATEARTRFGLKTLAERAAVRPEPAEVQRIACVGAGVIGGGWAAHFWRAAMRSWPGTSAGRRSAAARAGRNRLAGAQALGLAADASPDRLTFAATLEEAVAEAGFVQEARRAPRAETRAAASDRSRDAAKS